MSAKKTEKIRRMLKAKNREQKIQDAVEEVLKGKPCFRAAKEYDLAESTLRDRVIKAKKGIHGESAAKHLRLFTDAQENMLEELYLWLASIGYRCCEWQILDMAKQMAFVMGVRTPSRSWLYQGFLVRHPDVAMCKHRGSVTQEMGNEYFEELGRRLDSLGIKNSMHHIFNMDEMGVSLNHSSPPKVLNFSHETPTCQSTSWLVPDSSMNHTQTLWTESVSDLFHLIFSSIDYNPKTDHSKIYGK